MVLYSCKECGKEFSNSDEGQLIEKVHDHMHVDHGKHVGRSKIRKRLKE